METARYYARGVRLFERAVASGKCTPEVVVGLEQKISEVRKPLGELCMQGGEVVVIWGVLAHGPRIAQKLPPNQGNARASRRAELGARARRIKMQLHHQAI
eukprot:SAG11_NODE_13546_length_650_cov_1.226860_1_plen_100_part_10